MNFFRVRISQRYKHVDPKIQLKPIVLYLVHYHSCETSQPTTIGFCWPHIAQTHDLLPLNVLRIHVTA